MKKYQKNVSKIPEYYMLCADNAINCIRPKFYTYGRPVRTKLTFFDYSFRVPLMGCFCKVDIRMRLPKGRLYICENIKEVPSHHRYSDGWELLFVNVALCPPHSVLQKKPARGTYETRETKNVILPANTYFNL